MSQDTRQQPLDFTDLKTVPIHARGGKVRVEHFAQPYAKGAGVAGLLDSLPHILAADSFRAVIEALRRARDAEARDLCGAWAATSSSADSRRS